MTVKLLRHYKYTCTYAALLCGTSPHMAISTLTISLNFQMQEACDRLKRVTNLEISIARGSSCKSIYIAFCTPCRNLAVQSDCKTCNYNVRISGGNSRPLLVSRARLSHREERESGQIPSINSCLTCPELLGVLIDLATNGGVQLLF